MTYAEILIRKGKRGAAAYVQAECTSANADPSRSPLHLNALLDHLLHPEKNIDDSETIDWCRWLVGGGRSYEDFSTSVREFDNTSKCGLVWTADFVAFRCRTCGISQCMSLCADCFKEGNHDGHDFNMFKSQAGGACDCGDASVMHESGFCKQHHGPNSPGRPVTPPPDLMCVATNMLPRIILRLVQHLRINTIPSKTEITPAEASAKYEQTIANADMFLILLHDFSSLGAAMRSVMTRCLIDSTSYANLTQQVYTDSEYSNFMRKSQFLYDDALSSLPNPDPPREFQDCPALTEQLQHRTFLEELVFWTVKYEFPEKLVCLLLKMLPDAEYKEAFTRSFVLHYSRVSMTLVKSSNSDKLSNRVVHVSVQLFSNEELALSMTENLCLLHIMVSSLKNMMSGVLIPCALHNNTKHQVVDCSKHTMKDHCYWPLVSDLNNVLSHQPIAFKFMSDNSLLTMWFDFLQMLQGMNVNERELESHVEFEPNTYYASFSGELEAASSTMWALVGHLVDTSTRDCTSNVLKHCISAIRDWFSFNEFNSPDQCDLFKVSFHIPLHRYFALFVRQAVRYQGFSLKDVLPEPEILSLMMAHPLRVQTAFYEIMCGLWVRNGIQIKGQAMTYLQCHFCKSMVDLDIFLLQLCATQLQPVTFLSSVLERYQMDDWLSLSTVAKPSRLRISNEQVVPMLESCLTFLVSILVIRTNLGLNEEELSRLEMVTLLCMGDKQHSKLYEHMPEKCGNPIQTELFDQVLREVGQYREPQFEPGGNMQQGIYLPKPEVWEDLYDPIYVLLRAVHRKDFQSSIDRFNQFAQIRFQNDPDRAESVIHPWPPWRLPTKTDPGFTDPRRVLHSRYAHGLIFNILFKAVQENNTISEHIISLAVYLLELSLTYPQTEFSGKEVAVSKPWLMVHEPLNLKYDTWFPTDWLSANLRHTVSAIFTTPSNSESMEVDPVIEEQIETPSAVLPSIEGTSHPTDYSRSSSLVAITGPPSNSTTEVAISQERGSNIAPPPPLAVRSENKSVVSINESIISLLLKLHSKFSQKPDSYKPVNERTGYSTKQEYRESRIGNACFFLEKVLDRIMESDDMCSQNVKMCRTMLWPSYHNDEAKLEENQERAEAENRKKLAKERQKRMMEALKLQQRRFMANAMETELSSDQSAEAVVKRKKEYDCVHCHLSSPSTEEHPIGLVVLFQSTSVLSHKHREHAHLVLPTSQPEESHSLNSGDSLGSEYEARFQELSQHFDPQSYLLAVNKGWAGGIHIQSCGHYVHLHCRQGYMEHLKSQQRQGSHQNLAVDHGEYMCPMCRQLSNSVLPVPPDDCNESVVALSANDPVETARHIHRLLSDNSASFGVGNRSMSPLRRTMSQIMEHFTKATLPQYRPEGSNFPNHVVVLFVNSIARTNLELDLVQRGGSLISNNFDNQSPSIGVNRPKPRFIPLLHVLAIHMKFMCPRTFMKEWDFITGLSCAPRETGGHLVVKENSVPILLLDCITLLLHFILILPVNMDIACFNVLVKAVYNLHLAQSLSKLSCGLSDKERNLFKREAIKHPKLTTLYQYLGDLIEHHEAANFYSSDLDFNGSEPDFPELEVPCMELALPYLRIASLLRHYVYSQPLPEVFDVHDEFSALTAYLELSPPSSLTVVGFHWLADSGESRIKHWCGEYATFIAKAPNSARQLLQVNSLWSQPRLMKLPQRYDSIFQYYHKKSCKVCQKIPKDPSVCLLCGVLVCLKEECCKINTATGGMCEAVRHSLDCGAGTAMFLAVNSSTIVVIRGKRACIWGSIYLDSFGEEDKELKRGKPLFLNTERYKLLQLQWLTHRFDHTNRSWIWHKDLL